MFTKYKNLFYSLILTGSTRRYVVCLSLSGFKPSTAFPYFSLAHKKCGKENSTGTPKQYKTLEIKSKNANYILPKQVCMSITPSKKQLFLPSMSLLSLLQ